jgi:hypothetical protein
VTNPVAPPPIPGGAVPPPPADGAAPPAEGAVPPGGYPPPPATEGMGDAPKKKSGIGKKVLGLVGILVVALIIGIVKLVIVDGINAVQDKTDDAKVGSCLNNETDLKKIAVVACTDAAAAYKVVGKVPDVSEKKFNVDNDFVLCKTFATAENSLWSGTEGADGYVLCLEPVTHK